MTQTDALNWLNGGWQSSKYAKTIQAAGGLGIDQDGVWGFQCKDFANAYAEYMGAPLPIGNAIVLMGDVPGWHEVSEPQPGDLAIRSYVSGGVEYGDVCMVLQSLGNNNFVFIGQNQTQPSLTIGHVPTTFTGSKTKFKRYLRLNNLEDNMGFTKKPIEPDLIRQHLSNFTNGAVQVNTSDAVCQNRFELNDENWGGEFWKGLNFQQLDIIKARDAEIVELKKQIGTQDPDSVTVTKTSLWDWFKNLPFIKKG